jgi:thymidylate kinase
MVDAVFQALDRANLRWCLLRGEAGRNQASGDIDLLVSPADLHPLRRVIGQLGFAPVPAWGHGSHSFFLGYDRAMDQWVKLDVVTEIAFGAGFALATGAEAACLERRHRKGHVSLLDDEDAFWALLLHRLLDKGSIPQDSATCLRELAMVARGDGPLAAVVDAFSPPDCSAVRLLDLARDGDWEALIAFGPQLAASWRRRGRAAVWRRRSANTAARWAGRLLRLRYRRGLSVAVLAPDGAGKTTLVQGLRDTFAFPTHTIYMGLYQGHAGRSDRSLLRGVSLASRLCTVWTRWLEGAYHRGRGQLVVFDRYVTDALLLSRQPLGAVSRARRWLVAHCVPAPGLMVVLDAPGATLHQRKGEHDVEMLEARRRAYQVLAQEARWGARSRGPYGAVVIDATQSANHVRREVTAAVWHLYQQRWGKWRTGARRNVIGRIIRGGSSCES